MKRRNHPRRTPSLLREGAFAISGLLARLDRTETTPPRVILMYHSHAAGYRWGTDIEEFERQVTYVTSRFRLVRLSDLLEAPDHAEAPTACLTFDDGYLDNYEKTLPILERAGVKGTFFLIPGLLGGKLLTSQGPAPLMSEEQARELVSLGHEVGSHTMSHRSLTEISPEEGADEVTQSKRALEDMLGVPVRSFAYPRGRVNQAVIGLPEAGGYAMAVTTREALVPSDPDWFALPRVSVDRTVGSVEFRAKLTRALDVHNRLRRGPRPATTPQPAGSNGAGTTPREGS